MDFDDESALVEVPFRPLLPFHRHPDLDHGRHRLRGYTYLVHRIRLDSCTHPGAEMRDDAVVSGSRKVSDDDGMVRAILYGNGSGSRNVDGVRGVEGVVRGVWGPGGDVPRSGMLAWPERFVSRYIRMKA